MIMTLRWYGAKYDTVSLKQIRQIPGVEGVIGTLYEKLPGELWEKDEIRKLKAEVEHEGLCLAGIESVNIHEDIKSGKGQRDLYIDRYIKTLEHLGQEGIRLVCYNFMPVFDWTRTELSRKRKDGSYTMAYDQSVIDRMQPEKMFERLSSDTGTMLPGWEPERLPFIKESMKAYEDVDNKKLFSNLVYFLEAIMPTCRKYDIRMAIHPDDPCRSVFGLPRIITDQESTLRMLYAVNDVHNGVTFCTGSFGSNRANNLTEMIKSMEGRIHFAHVRNLKYNSGTDFEEAAHLSADGDLDIYAIMKALYETGFDGPVRPDHGRMIWDEQAMPGYGLYDRALGASYLNGLLEAIMKNQKDVKNA